jgi:protein O-mannosyl-transferase
LVPTPKDASPASADPEALPLVRRLLLPLALAALTVLAYADAAPNVLIFDDAVVIWRNRAVGGVATIPELFRRHARYGTGEISRLYRPVAMATIAVDRSLHGAWRRGYHITNIGMHVTCTLMIFGLLVALGTGRWVGFAAALVFGVHPIHTETVNQVFNRSEILSTIGAVGFLWWVWRWYDRRRVLALAGAAVIYFLTLLCRESAVSLPVLAALLLCLLRPSLDLRKELRRLWPLALLALPLGLYLWMRQAALAAQGGGVASSLSDGLGLAGGLAERLPLVAVTVRDYLRMLVWPWPHRLTCGDYVVRGLGLAVALHVALIGAAVLLRRRAPAFAVAVGFFYLAILPSTKLFGDPAVLAERFVYLPSAGGCLALAFGFRALGSRAGPRVVAMLAFGLWGTFMPLTLSRNMDFHTDLALWEAEGQHTRNDWQVLLNLSNLYISQGRLEEVVALCNRGLEINPKNHGLYTNRGIAFVKMERFADAESSFRMAVALGGGARDLANLARLHAKLGRFAESELEYERAISVEPEPAQRHVLRGEMLLRCRFDAARARAEFEAALALDPRLRAALEGLETARAAELAGTAFGPSSAPSAAPKASIPQASPP